MKLNGTHHQSPRVHDWLMKSTSPRLDDHLPLYSFYLKLVSISVQNELGRIHFWKNIFLFFFYVHLSLFFVICIKIVSAATILMTCLQKLPAVTLPSSQTIKFLVTKKNHPPRQEIVVFFWCSVCPPLKKCLCDFFFLLTDWGASVILLWDLMAGIWTWMYQIMYVSSLLLLLSLKHAGMRSGFRTWRHWIWIWSGSNLDLIRIWFSLDLVWRECGWLSSFFLIIQITPTSLQHDYVDPSAVTGSLLTFLWLRRNLWNKLLTRTWGLEESLSFFLLRSVLPVPRLEEKPPCVGSAL